MSKDFLFLAALFGFFMCGAAGAQDTAPAGSAIVHCGTLLAVPGEAPMRNATVIVRDGRIREMIELGEQATVYDRRSADLKFHQALADLSGSRILAQTLKPLIRRVLLSTTVGFRFGRASRSFEEHCDVLSAIKDRDGKRATRLLRAHLRGALKFQIEVWERQ